MPFSSRRHSVTTLVGGVPVGAGHPVVVQSMTNTDTGDAAATAAQVIALARAGSQLVRVTVNNEAAAAAVPELVQRVADQGVTVPIIGDFHYNGHLLLARYPDCARLLAKYRINPGNVGGKRRDENFRTIVQIALRNDKPVRIGVNWGSLDQDLLTALMDENAAQMSFADESFDVVLSNLCLHNIPTAAGRERACQEIVRVLKPGGTAVISDFRNLNAYRASFLAGDTGITVQQAGPFLEDTFPPLGILTVGKPEDTHKEA